MQRLFVEFDPYEIALLRATQKRMARLCRAQGKKAPTLQDVVRGAVRVAIHLIEGEEVVLDPEELRRLLESDQPIDTCLSPSAMPPLEEEGSASSPSDQPW